jgi:hypothetical protein
VASWRRGGSSNRISAIKPATPTQRPSPGHFPFFEAAPMAEATSSVVSQGLARCDTLDDEKWKVLLRRIQNQKCTPFLGPETCFDFSVPPASLLALEWADHYDYPFDDRNNLPRVAQFVAYQVQKGDVNAVKEELADKFRALKVPDFSNPDEPYRILASLPLSVYINTHYFAFMSMALMSQHKEPRKVVCHWTDMDFPEDDPDLPAAYDPKPACPLVFHMFGHIADPRSLVLTEDDYLDFLLGIASSDKQELIPQPVQSAMKNNSLLFFGYQTSDLDFRVILRSLYRIWQGSSAAAKRPNAKSYSIQLVHVSDEKVTSDQIGVLKEYFNRYCDATMSIGVYWGTTSQFMTELRQRWEDYRVHSAPG